MSSEGRTATRRALVLGVAGAALALLVAVGLLLREYGPGNMGTGFLGGAAVALVGSAVMWWRAVRRPHSATTIERAWTQTGDERDDAVLTRALAVLGLLAVPLTGAAAIAIGLGATVAMVLTMLLVSQIVLGAVAFVVIDRRS